jgi:hypothetical protein
MSASIAATAVIKAVGAAIRPCIPVDRNPLVRRKLSRSGIVKFLAEVEPCAHTMNGFRPTHPTL